MSNNLSGLKVRILDSPYPELVGCVLPIIRIGQNNVLILDHPEPTGRVTAKQVLAMPHKVEFLPPEEE